MAAISRLPTAVPSTAHYISMHGRCSSHGPWRPRRISVCAVQICSVYGHRTMLLDIFLFTFALEKAGPSLRMLKRAERLPPLCPPSPPVNGSVSGFRFRHFDSGTTYEIAQIR